MFDGKVPHWHHFSCFWQRAAAQSTSDIDGFSGLRWEDQEKVKKAIESGGATGGKSSLFKRHVSSSSFLTEFARCAFLFLAVGYSSAGGTDSKSGAKEEKTLNEFAVEYAKSNRSTCKGCEQKIEKVRPSFHSDLLGKL